MQSARRLRRARLATMIAFATNGALPASLLARYAEVKESLTLDAGLFGLLVAGFMIGAAAAFQLPGTILRRLGSRRTATIGTAWIAVALVVATAGVLIGNQAMFMVGLMFAGFGDAVVDVAQNAQGLRVQEAYGRSLLSSMHAGWSVGAAVGGLVGTAAAAAGVPMTIHLAAWGLCAIVTMAAAARSFLPDDGGTAVDDQGGSRTGRRSRVGSRTMLLLAPLALVALAGISVEDVGNNWSAVLLATERGVPAAAAGIGLSILLGAQFVGRFFGDRFIDRAGRRRALITSLTLVAGGLVLAAWVPWAPATLLGLAVAGLGCAITVPLAFAVADALPGLTPHAGVTWINWVMRAATIGLTPAIGGITSLASLPVAITIIALLALAALLVQARPWRAAPGDANGR